MTQQQNRNMATNFGEMISLERVGGQKYKSIHNPEKMGNTANIAYGGCTLAIAVAAAHATIPPTHKIYSAQGSFLGPALTDRPYLCSVREIRSTRTFATRLVEVSQSQDNGQERLCMIMLADFHVLEKSMMVYSKPPPHASSFDDSSTAEALRADLVAKGAVSRALADMHKTQFTLLQNHFDSRSPPESIAGQNLLGMAKAVMTTQEDRHLTEKSTTDWHRCRSKLDKPVEHIAGIAFIMDAAMAFIGLTHSHKFIDDAAACSTLDFSLRILTADVDLNEWHLREVKTHGAAEGRTYSEGQMWTAGGKLVASMTQTSILRPHKGSHL